MRIECPAAGAWVQLLSWMHPPRCSGQVLLAASAEAMPELPFRCVCHYLFLYFGPEQGLGLFGGKHIVLKKHVLHTAALHTLQRARSSSHHALVKKTRNILGVSSDNNALLLRQQYLGTLLSTQVQSPPVWSPSPAPCCTSCQRCQKLATSHKTKNDFLRCSSNTRSEIDSHSF